MQTYTDGRANSFLDGNGHLVIRVTKDGNTHQSARLKTAGKFSQYRGTFEARIKLNVEPGLWPAWWAMGSKGGPRSGEVDMLENYGRDHAETTVWTPNKAGTGMEQEKHANVPVDDGWHTWRMQWDGTGFTFCKDGVKYLTVTPAQLANWGYSSGDALFMLLNVAVGGAAGTPPASVQFPVDAMTVDWIRVWQ
jgi:beta-glucanase (GH16 family)